MLATCEDPIEWPLWVGSRHGPEPATTSRSCSQGPDTRDLRVRCRAGHRGVDTTTCVHRLFAPRPCVVESAAERLPQRGNSEDSVKRIWFIKRAQDLGFTLAEIANLLALEDGRSCRETRELAGRKLAIVESRLTDLSRLRRTLRELIAGCDTSRGKVSCPIISVLSSDRSQSPGLTALHHW